MATKLSPSRQSACRSRVGELLDFWRGRNDSTAAIMLRYFSVALACGAEELDLELDPLGGWLSPATSLRN